MSHFKINRMTTNYSIAENEEAVEVLADRGEGFLDEFLRDGQGSHDRFCRAVRQRHNLRGCTRDRASILHCLDELGRELRVFRGPGDGQMVTSREIVYDSDWRSILARIFFRQLFSKIRRNQNGYREGDLVDVLDIAEVSLPSDIEFSVSATADSEAFLMPHLHRRFSVSSRFR